MTNGQKRETARIIQQALINDLGDEVEVVFEYGSQVKGTTHRFSDVDMSYVPVHESTWDSITVLVEDTLYDLYPIHWSTLERMAEWTDWRGSILGHCKVVYAKNHEAREQFEGLLARHQALTAPDARTTMIEKALGIYAAIGWEHYQLTRAAEREDFLDARIHSQRIADSIFHCLIVLNQSSADTRVLDEMGELRRIPANFVSAVTALLEAATAVEILDRTTKLLNGVRDLLLSEQRTERRSNRSFAQVLGTAYPELKADLQKILICCERRDKLGATGKLVSLVHELSYHLAVGIDGVEYGSFNSTSDYDLSVEGLGIPRLLQLAAAGKFDELAAGCLDLDHRMRETITGNGARLYEFESVDKLSAYLEDRTR